MKKFYVFVFIGLAVLGVALGCSKGYETGKTVGDLAITLSAAKYPLVQGDNTLTVRLADQSGKAVTDARTAMRFYMPPMPGMAPMDSTMQGAPSNDAYLFKVNVAMEGGWKAEVTAARPGKEAATTTFNLDAR